MNNLKKLVGVFFCVALSMAFTYAQEMIQCENELNVYSPTEDVRFRCPPAEISYQIEDNEGQVVRRDTLKSAKTDWLNAGVLDNGFYLLKYTLTTNGKASQNTLAFAVIPEIDNQRNIENNPFGMMVFPHWNDPMELRAKDARYIKRLGLRWVRTHKLGWIFLQKDEASPIDWAAADAEVKNWEKYGLDIIATIGWPTPVWASSGNEVDGISREEQRSMLPSEQWHDAFMKFHTELAKRFSKNIGYYEIGNEVDAFEFWRGSPSNWEANDKKAIMADYLKLFEDISSAIRKEDPAAKIAPNTTGSAPEGHYYSPWLKTMYELGLGKTMNTFSTHYLADLKYIRQIMKQYGEKELPVILTEAGAVVKRVGNDNVYTREYFEEAMRRDMSQFVTQYFYGVQVICKFMLRPTPFWKDSPPYFCSLLATDFTMFPNYVAFATIIRFLKDSTPIRELNITDHSGDGWLQGFEFVRDGKTINAIWLNRAKKANVHFETAQNAIDVVDMMGRSKTLVPQDGKIEFTITTPVFIIGKLKDNPGEVLYPQPVLISTIDCSPANSGFENVTSTEMLSGWAIKKYPTYFASIADGGKDSAKALRADSVEKLSDWWPLRYSIRMSDIPALKQAQSITVSVDYDEKGQDIKGIGTTCAIAVTDQDGNRLRWKDNPDWGRGMYDWCSKHFEWKIDNLSQNKEQLVVEFYLGKATGTVWWDNIKITVSVYEDPRGGAANTN